VFGERLVGPVHDCPDATAFADEVAAGIGHRCCMDHGNGVVMGETAELGDDVKLCQGDTVVALDSVIGGNVWLTRSVPPFSKLA
jgi:hypothetical protein